MSEVVCVPSIVNICRPESGCLATPTQSQKIGNFSSVLAPKPRFSQKGRRNIFSPVSEALIYARDTNRLLATCLHNNQFHRVISAFPQCKAPFFLPYAGRRNTSLT
jgi:hypothetical protein